MFLKKKKPKTPSLRHQLLLNRSTLYKNKKIKDLLYHKKKNSGRNANGHITIRHRGGGSRLLIRQIKWETLPAKNIVIGIEYDPNRTALIARLFNINEKKYNYTLATNLLYPGSNITYNASSGEIRLGNRMPLINIPTGSIINAVSLPHKSKPIFSTAAGTSCQLLQKGPLFSKIRIPSGDVKFISSISLATIGKISNEHHILQKIGKAGKNRHKGIRPTVRGVAMNPVDHPHGGAGGRPSVSPWGKPTKGKPTVLRKNKK